MSADKALVTSGNALAAKYGSTGARQVQAALAALADADSRRGLNDKIIDLSDPEEMRAFGVPPVTDPKSCKVAVDAIFRVAEPAFLMLVGGPDVIPHQPLDNPTPDDGDPTVPSDLPYACDAPYSTEPAQFTGPTRVVGRLPDLTGGKAPVSYLLDLVKNVIGLRPATAEAFRECFAVSAEVWQKSTEESLAHIAGSQGHLHLVPPEGPDWTTGQLASRRHFVNCHGASDAPEWYGQRNSQYPVALTASGITDRIGSGTAVAAECCYGAQLYDAVRHPTPICNTYLHSKASTFFGSTTIAYGPAAGNGQADLIAQYLLIDVMSGVSAGLAALKARQEFVRHTQPSMSPADLKTLAQFILLGDPSVAPVTVPAPVGVEPDAADTEHRRHTRLVGATLERDIAVPVPIPDSERGSELEERLRRIGEQYDLHRPAISSFAAEWKGEPALLRTTGILPRYHLLHEKRDPQAPVPTDVIVTVREEEGHIVAVDEVVAR
ncbi:hypothetical protein [Streptomyces sp. NPDC086766]|uniref:hypothetical protein n=1 Tax=Streptomyces sp. NPDC086766 TaxID=3365754 RepID=UPI0037F86F4C